MIELNGLMVMSTTQHSRPVVIGNITLMGGKVPVFEQRGTIRLLSVELIAIAELMKGLEK